MMGLFLEKSKVFEIKLSFFRSIISWYMNISQRIVNTEENHLSILQD